MSEFITKKGRKIRWVTVDDKPASVLEDIYVSIAGAGKEEMSEFLLHPDKVVRHLAHQRIIKIDANQEKG